MPENIIQIDQNLLETRLDRLITEKMTQILNAMLDAEADEITGAARYERSGGRKAYRAGHYERKLTAKAGRLELKVPKPKDAVFESAVIERYRRREQSVEKSSTDMCLAGADSYETRSVIFTSNLEFSRWGDVFGDGDMAAAVIDRIVHHGRILRFHGESYRNKHSLMK